MTSERQRRQRATGSTKQQRPESVPRCAPLQKKRASGRPPLPASPGPSPHAANAKASGLNGRLSSGGRGRGRRATSKLVQRVSDLMSCDDPHGLESGKATDAIQGNLAEISVGNRHKKRAAATASDPLARCSARITLPRIKRPQVSPSHSAFTPPTEPKAEAKNEYDSGDAFDSNLRRPCARSVDL
jgi:hypothetical protein